MPSDGDYVKIEDRVRVVRPFTGMFELQVFKDSSPAPGYGEWGVLRREQSRKRLAESRADTEAAIRLACEAVRERCAREAAYGICGSFNPSEEPDHPHNQHAMQIVAAIRGLDL